MPEVARLNQERETCITSSTPREQDEEEEERERETQ